MKKIIIFALILFLAASCAKQSSDVKPVVTENLNKVLGQEFRLSENQTAVFDEPGVSIKLVGFYNQPCPQGLQCVWSGLDVYYELNVNGKKYIHNKTGDKIGDFPFVVEIINSDYKSYAVVKVSKKEVVLPQGEKTGWETYSNSQYGFSVQYPKNDFGLYTDYNKVKSLSYIPVCNDSMLGCLVYSKDKQPNTNFEGAGVSLDRLGLGTEASCLMVQQGETRQADLVINGVNFAVYKGSGAATGHFEEYINYRTFKNNDCIGITLRVTSTNIGNYEPGTVKEFNSNEVWNKLKQVLSTFNFTK